MSTLTCARGVGRGRQGSPQDLATIHPAPVLARGNHLDGKVTVEQGQDHCWHLWVYRIGLRSSPIYLLLPGEPEAMGETWIKSLGGAVSRCVPGGQPKWDWQGPALAGSTEMPLPRAGHRLLCVSREEFRAAIVELLPYKTTKKPHQNSPKDKVVVVRMGGTESVLGQATPVPLPSPVHCTPCSSSLSSR